MNLKRVNKAKFGKISYNFYKIRFRTQTANINQGFETV